MVDSHMLYPNNQLRAQLAAVTKERDELREQVARLQAEKEILENTIVLGALERGERPGGES